MTLNFKTEALLHHIGGKLYKIRHLKKEKITSVAKAINVSHGVISQVENGKYKCLSIELLSKIAGYYETGIDDLLTDTEHKSSNELSVMELLLNENKALKEQLAELLKKNNEG